MKLPLDTEVRTCLLVLGMHRSGTSAVTRVLNLLGAALPIRMLPANNTNESGHWEPEELVRFHDKMLTELGSTWHDWRPLRVSALTKARRNSLKKQIQQIINEDYPAAGLFVVKDPRICRFAPLFIEALEESNIKIVPVIIIRNPLEVTASLKNRSSIWPSEYLDSDAALLWFSHVTCAERATRGYQRAIITYDELMADWSRAVTRIEAHSDSKFPIARSKAAPRIDEFLSIKLRHFARSLDEVSHDPILGGWFGATYDAVAGLAKSPDSKHHLCELDKKVQEFTRVVPLISSVQAAAHLSRVEASNSGARPQIDQSSPNKMRTKIDYSEEKIRSIEIKYNRTKEILTENQELIKVRDSELRNLEHQFIKAKEQADEAGSILGSLDQRLSTLSRSNEELKNAIEKIQRKNREIEKEKYAMNDYLKKKRILENFREIELREYRKDRFLKYILPWRIISELLKARNVKHDRKLIVNSRLFDSEWYYEKNPDVRSAGVDPAVHYLKHGAYEGRQPSEFFDSVFYLLHYPDIAAAGINPLVHYIRHGAREGRQIAPQNLGTTDDSNPETESIEVEEMAPISVTDGIVRRISSLGRNIVSTEIENRVQHLNRFVRYEVQDSRSIDRVVDFSRLRVSWIIPDFEPGAGGHMTIFRIARYLEKFGHEVNFFVQNPSHHSSGDAAHETINKHFQPFRGKVELFDSELPVSSGDALIATDRFTCYPVNSMSGFARKFYFVQDYETLFYPAGTEAFLTDATYKFDFDCLCAGEWLHEMMKEKFGRWSVSWPLAYDPEHYRLGNEANRANNRIAFYARYVTPRRAVELGFMALDILHGRGVDFEVDFFGRDLGALRTGYRQTNHGVVDAQLLAEMYRRATVGLVFSATNHSLVNKEMMACGLPVIDLDLESVRKIFPPASIAYAKPTPEGIADAIQSVLENEERQRELRDGGLELIDGLSWERSARIIENALKERVSAAVANV